MASLRSRNRTAGFLSGFLGEQNNEFRADRKAKRDMTNRLQELKEKSKLEIAKSDYTRQQQRLTTRRTGVGAIRAVGGVGDDGRLNQAGVDTYMRNTVKGYSDLSKEARQEIINSRDFSRSADDIFNDTYGPGPKDFGFDGSPASSTVNQVTRNIAEKNRQEVEYNKPTAVGVAPDPKVLSSERTVRNGVPGLSEVIRNPDGSRRTIFTPTGDDPEKSKIVQTADTYVDSEGNPVNVVFDQDGVYEPIRDAEGNIVGKNFQVTKEADVDAGQRVAGAKERKEVRGSFTTSLSGVATAQLLLDNRLPQAFGLQGQWAQAVDYVGSFANFYQTLEDGRELKDDQLRAMNINPALSREDSTRAAEVFRDKMIRSRLGEELQGDIMTEEDLTVTESILSRAAQDVRLQSLVYYTAQVYRGEGKLTQDDRKAILELVKVGASEGKFQGSIREIQAELYDRAVKAVPNLINMNSELSSIAQNLGDMRYLKDSEGRRAPGFLAQIRNPTTEVSYVFVNSQTGRSFGMTGEQFTKFRQGMEIVPEPKRVRVGIRN